MFTEAKNDCESVETIKAFEAIGADVRRWRTPLGGVVAPGKAAAFGKAVGYGGGPKSGGGGQGGGPKAEAAAQKVASAKPSFVIRTKWDHF